MTFRRQHRAVRPAASGSKPNFRTGDVLVDPQGERFIIGYRDDEQHYLILRPEGAPKNATDIRYATYDELDNHWIHLSRKEVSSMARPANPLKPPKMNKAEWLKREKTRVSLTRGELEYLAQLVAAGHVLIRDDRSISPKLKGAMSRLGISTRGL